MSEVIGEAQPADDAVLTTEGGEVPFRSLELIGPYRHDVADQKEGEDYREWILPVRWIGTVDRAHALLKHGLFANQNSACKLRNAFTIDAVTRFFDLD